MDEGLLNDLLECSVCLERLDTSSRVLPCQHTFCLKCLKEIVESHKELRCPECRVLVDTKVEELPPNVLLMRILEGMRNSAPRKPGITAQRLHRNVQQGSQHSGQGHQVSRVTGGDCKQIPPHARAMHDYISKEPGDLSFKKGELIYLHKKLDSFWYQGECSGRSGVFPLAYVQVIVPLPTPTALSKALYDFRMSAPDEEGCLAFDKGAIITVHRRVDENWAEGRLEDKVGIFPIAFVELNQAARQLMKSSTLNRSVPPIPDLSLVSRPGHSEHRHHPQVVHRFQPMSMSTPTSVQQSNYHNVTTMSQSHPIFQVTGIITPQSQILVPHPISHNSVSITQGGLLASTTLCRNIVEPAQTKAPLELLHYTNIHKTSHNVAVQNVPRIPDGCETRYRAIKYENTTPVHHKAETTYQNVRPQVSNFNSNSSDSSSSINTPSAGASSTSTPNTSSNTSACESGEPSLPSSPDNTERPVNTVQPEDNNDSLENSLNTSMGVLSVNESSTATNTSLNVSLPPAESPKLSNSVQKHAEPSTQPEMTHDTPNTSRLRSGPDSLLNFGLGLQAALSPSHGNDSLFSNSRSYREQKDKEKRHSLTPGAHLQPGQQSTPNRHSAEILATSLLDSAPDRERNERERDRRRRRSRSNERPLPAAYIALYPYKPQKPDELELKKGGIYMVTERCRDGWYKGCSERSQRCGVFPGNYVAPAHTRAKHDKVAAVPSTATVKSTQSAVSSVRSEQLSGSVPPPDAPPREPSPTSAQPMSYPWIGNVQTQLKTEKSKEKSRQEKSTISTGVSLMKRLAAMKKCKSPPPVGYSMDNPVFEDGPGTSVMVNLTPVPSHPVHVRSGSCPSQLLRALPGEMGGVGLAHRTGASSHRLRTKERPSVFTALADAHARHTGRSSDSPWLASTQHRKSQSLDVTSAAAVAAAARRERSHAHSQPTKERFRCIVPYPPNSEYELELKVDDIVLVHRKRGDGWYKGTLQRTGRTGLFPASFVQNCPAE